MHNARFLCYNAMHYMNATHYMRKNIKTVFICIGAVILKVACATLFCNVLNIPLFFDTIFTVAAVFYCGLVPALCVSLGYNLVNGLLWVLETGVFDPFIFLYAVCGVLIVLSTWIVARRTEELKIAPAITALYLFLIALFPSACTVVAGGIIDYFHYVFCDIPDKMNPIKKFTESFVHQHFPLSAACILAQIPVSFLDRLIATFSGYGVFRLAEKLGGRR